MPLVIKSIWKREPGDVSIFSPQRHKGTQTPEHLLKSQYDKARKLKILGMFFWVCFL